MEWQTFFIGDEEHFFLIEVAIRTCIMFLIILVFLRLLGKRGIRQLSVFELVVIIGLGSAAGDPMIYREIGILQSLITFSAVLICYKVVTFLVFRKKSIENLVEGKPVCIVKNGVFTLEEFKKETLSKDEFFMELRLKGVFHLGQLEFAVLEITGDVSVFFFSRERVRYGLPILPSSLEKIETSPNGNHFYSCLFCGFTQCFTGSEDSICPRCKKKEWILSSNRKVDKN